MLRTLHLIFLTFVLGAVAFAQPDGQLLERVVAWMDEEPILLTELEEALVQFQSEGILEPGEPTEEKMRAALERLIDEKLILREARKQGIKIESVALDNRVDALINRLAERNGGVEAFNAAIAAQGIAPVAFRERLRKQIEQEWMIARALSGRISITQEDIDAFVAERKAKGEPVERFALSHAFLPVAKDAVADAWDAAEADLYLLLARTRRKGDFEAEAQAWVESRRAEGAEAGSLGIVDPGEIHPALGKALMQLKEGETSEPIRSDRGVHVLYLQRRTSPREILHAQRYRETRREWVESLRRDASIQTSKKILE